MSNPVFDGNGTKQWFNEKGQLHRLDGPAIIYKTGRKCWYQNGTLHRTDGPAIIREDGTERWYINGKDVKPMPKHIILWSKKLDESRN